MAQWHSLKKQSPFELPLQKRPALLGYAPTCFGMIDATLSFGDTYSTLWLRRR